MQHMGPTCLLHQLGRESIIACRTLEQIFSLKRQCELHISSWHWSSPGGSQAAAADSAIVCTGVNGMRSLTCMICSMRGCAELAFSAEMCPLCLYALLRSVQSDFDTAVATAIIIQQALP